MVKSALTLISEARDMQPVQVASEIDYNEFRKES